MHGDARVHTPGPAVLAAASRPQDRPRGAPALQVAYFQPSGSYSLHYFPYYGKKAQVRGPRAQQQPLLTKGRLETFACARQPGCTRPTLTAQPPGVSQAHVLTQN